MLLDRLRDNPIDTPQAPRSILPDNIPLEFQVLLSACRVFLGTEEPSSLKARLAQGPDWDRLLRLANRHGVMPLLYRSISKNCPQAVPQEWLRRLMLQYMQNAARNMKMTGELLRILDLFEENGIAAIPFKGPALAEQIYGDVTLRMFADLDIIVQKDDVLRAKNILLLEGYCPEFQLNEEQEKTLLRFNCEYNFHHKARRVSVEVHWRLAWSGHALDFDINSIRPSMKDISLQGRSVPAIPPEDLLMALCIHATKHCWLDNTFKMILDLAALGCRCRDTDWSLALSRAEDMDMKRILLLGISLAERLAGKEILEEVSEEATGDPVANEIAQRVWEDLLFDRQKPSRLREEFFFWQKVRDSRIDGLMCILRLAIEPNPRDWALLSLPARLYPIYYLMRPVRLVRDYGRKD